MQTLLILHFWGWVPHVFKILSANPLQLFQIPWFWNLFTHLEVCQLVVAVSENSLKATPGWHIHSQFAMFSSRLSNSNFVETLFFEQYKIFNKQQPAWSVRMLLNNTKNAYCQYGKLSAKRTWLGRVVALKVGVGVGRWLHNRIRIVIAQSNTHCDCTIEYPLWLHNRIPIVIAQSNTHCDCTVEYALWLHSRIRIVIAQSNTHCDCTVEYALFFISFVSKVATATAPFKLVHQQIKQKRTLPVICWRIFLHWYLCQPLLWHA